MGVYAVLLTPEGHHLGSLSDPAGGRFDAAGDFDRLLRDVPAAALWSSIDPYADTTLVAGQARQLVPEIAVVMELAVDGPERRGLERLRVLAQTCASDHALRLLFVGD